MERSFNADIPFSEAAWRDDSYAREQAQEDWDELQMQDVELESRSTPDRPCCIDPSSFVAVPSLERDLDTGYLQGTYYRCAHCGTRICEEDYAAMVEYENRRRNLELLIEAEPVPAEYEVPVKQRKRVA